MAEQLLTIESELRKETKIGDRKGETRTQLLTRLAMTAIKLNERAWASLNDETQDWVNDARKAFKAKRAVSEPSKKPLRKVVLDKAAPPKKEEPIKHAVNGASYRPELREAAQMMVIKNIEIRPPEIYEILKNQGYETTLNNVSQMISNFKFSLRLLDRTNHLKNIKLPKLPGR